MPQQFKISSMTTKPPIDLQMTILYGNHLGHTTSQIRGTTDECDIMTIINKLMLIIKAWMEAVRLKLNKTTEFIYFGSRQQLAKCQEKTIKVLQEEIQLCNMVCYIGGYLNSTLGVTDNVSTKYKAAVINIIQTRNTRKCLTRDTLHTLMKSLVISHLDYCNSILAGIPNKSLRLMQVIQNMAARIILNKESYSTSTTECLKTLYWLPIET